MKIKAIKIISILNIAVLMAAFILMPLTSLAQSPFSDNPLFNPGGINNIEDVINTDLSGDPTIDDVINTDLSGYTPPPSPPAVNCNAGYVDGSGLGGILDLVGCLLKKTIPILITMAVIVFIYGIVVYIKNADNSEMRKEGNKAMLYGLVALFVMVSIWALVQVLGATIGVDVVIPQLQQV